MRHGSTDTTLAKGVQQSDAAHLKGTPREEGGCHKLEQGTPALSSLLLLRFFGKPEDEPFFFGLEIRELEGASWIRMNLKKSGNKKMSARAFAWKKVENKGPQRNLCGFHVA